ncbi:hypothetical protein KLEB273_gp082 [Bacillus phage vB_BauM_KLEB27-3]|nr:hypothetical protein KLEB273_gp082 [Bacillus phage vB_BauM_KLEB27-3]
MNEMTLQGLLRMGRSIYAQEDAKFMLIVVKAEGSSPEIIINPKENFESKLAYYEKAYNDDLTLKNNPNIQIIDYHFVENLDHHLS